MPPNRPTTLYTIGFTKSSAAHFFGRLQQAGVRRLIDVRLNNTSTLAGFTRRDDLEYFLWLHGIEYLHEPLLAPEAWMLKAIQSKEIDWDEYLLYYMAMLEAREVAEVLDPDLFIGPTVLLCSEATAEHCHRRLIAEHLRERWDDLEVVHL